MIEPEQLYTLLPDRPELGRPVLLHALDGFVDAGSARRLAVEHLLDALPHRAVAQFDADLLVDYRARRPPMLFDRDHWASYEAPLLTLHALEDERGTPFLLLEGPEPDVMWERFALAVEQLVARLHVRLSIALNAIPMNVPHTRPAGVIAHASRPELMAGHESWLGTVQVPGSASHLVEWRLASAGQDSMGFAVHVPHYAASADYPAASVTLLEAVARAADLRLPVAALQEQAAQARTLIDEQVAGAPDAAAMVSALEEQYDAFVRQRAQAALDEADLPSADELGAELERFLAQQPPPEPPV